MIENCRIEATPELLACKQEWADAEAAIRAANKRYHAVGPRVLAEVRRLLDIPKEVDLCLSREKCPDNPVGRCIFVIGEEDYCIFCNERA